MKTLEERMNELPPEHRQEVEDFVEFLLEKRRPKCGKRLRQDWGGALKEYRQQYTSVELQKAGVGVAPGLAQCG
ncbi:MAG: DUF2281 domain-containing protein [Candidatus Hydrogenedentes bacterium]|nr:DUF2281 domain-containing protein [Candidatus Hydrogenedentota bacterium]